MFLILCDIYLVTKHMPLLQHQRLQKIIKF